MLFVYHPDDDIEDNCKQNGYQYHGSTRNINGYVFTVVNKIARHAIDINIQPREQVNHASRQDEYAANQNQDFCCLFHGEITEAAPVHLFQSRECRDADRPIASRCVPEEFGQENLIAEDTVPQRP